MSTVDLARERIKKYKIDCDLQLGYVHAAYHDRHEADLRDMQETYAKYGLEELQFLPNEDAIREHVGTSTYQSALYEAGAGHIQPLKYLQGLARAAAKAGADIHQNTLVDFVDTASNQLHIKDGRVFKAKQLLICGNAYIQNVAPKQMRRTLANVTSSVLSTKPLSDNLARALLPHRDAVSDGNAALNYYRLDAQNRMIFGGRASYMIPDNPAIIGRDLQRRMASVFLNYQIMRLKPSGQGALASLSAASPNLAACQQIVILCKASLVTVLRYLAWLARYWRKMRWVMAQPLRLCPKLAISLPGGPLRTPVLALGMAYYKLRDRLKI